MLQMGTVVRNAKAYKPTRYDLVVELKVTVLLDSTPGAWHQPDDIVRWIARHSYVQDVTYVGPIEKGE